MPRSSSSLPPAFLLLLLSALVSCASPGPAVSPPEQQAVPPEAPAPEAEPLPMDPAVRVGKLPNGMTYVLRANQRPAHRAELRLVVNAGSILEDEDQLGLAHFVEHMAFNGTRHFEKQALVDYLESIGLRLGPDLNAYTSFDETVYRLQVPTDSAEQFDTALRILRDWASEVTFEEEEIEKERGVVIEEWRLGRGAQARIRDQQFPILFHGSRYAERLPIGKKEVLESFSPEALRRFYRDWYRPELMAVVAVGDFDVDALEQRLRTLFEDVPVRPEARPRRYFPVPDHDTTLVAIAGDPEASGASVAVYYKQPPQPQDTEADFRRELVEGLYNSMFNDRLRELTQQPDPPFIAAFSGQGPLVRTKAAYSLQALVRDGQYTRALEALLTEAERVRRFGFTPSEFERARTNLLRQVERAYAERDKTESGRYAGAYVRHVLTGEPIPGIAYEYETTRRLLPTLSLDEVNRLGARWITRTNRVLLADGPTREGSPPLPTAADLLAVFDAVAARTLSPYTEAVPDDPLVPRVPPPAPIVAEEHLPEIGVTRWTLANGVRVVLKPTDFKNDEVLVAATSPGGTSLVPDSLYIPALFAATLIGQSGVDGFGPIELQKKLAGKVVRLSPYLAEREEGFSGMASPRDLETLFQLVYLFFTQPRADSAAYLSYRQRLASFLENARNSPEKAFSDTLAVTLAQYHPRARPIDEAALEKLDLLRALDVFRERFADAGDFTFYVVGAFDPEALRPLVQAYLGNLPAQGRHEEPRDVGIRPPTGIVEKTVYRGTEPKSSVKIVLTGRAPWSNENRRLLRVLTDILGLRLRETLREDLGGVYGVSVSGGLQREPYEGYRIEIGFSCDPARVEELTRTVFAVMDTLRTRGPTPEEVTKAREAALRRHEVGLRENGYWLTALLFYDQHGIDPREILDGPPRFYRSLTPEAVRQAAQTYLRPDNYVRVVLLPEQDTGANR